MTYDFHIRDEWDNGEFMTGATVDLLEDGKVVHTETFTASSEDEPGPAFSAYGNGNDNHAGTLARSYAWAWIESQTTTLEDRLSADDDDEDTLTYSPKWGPNAGQSFTHHRVSE